MFLVSGYLITKTAPIATAIAPSAHGTPIVDPSKDKSTHLLSFTPNYEKQLTGKNNLKAAADVSISLSHVILEDLI